MTSAYDPSSPKSPWTTRWPEPLTPAQWGQRYPGTLDAVGVMGGAANVIMQLAMAGVGYGVLESRVESGSIFRHPIKRTRTTLTFLAVAMLGTPEEKLAYRKAINKAHAQVYSTEKSPVEYRAFDPKLQLWVASCLYWGLADTRRKLHGEMDEASEEAMYRQLAVLGTTLQVRPDMWPVDRAAFDAHWQQGLRELRIDPPVRAYLDALADLKFAGKPVSKLFGPLNRFITAGMLPAEVRAQMQWDWTPAQQRRFDRFLAVVAGINRLLPRVIRQAPIFLIMWDFRRRLRKGMPLA